MYNVTLTRQAVKDAQKLERAALKPKAAGLITIYTAKPFPKSPAV
jgi:hypothetical protein